MTLRIRKNRRHDEASRCLSPLVAVRLCYPLSCSRLTLSHRIYRVSTLEQVATVHFSWLLHMRRPGLPKALTAPADFEFIHTARPEESASTSVRKAVRTHVMRQFHKKSRERAAGTDRHKNQSDNTILPGAPTNECNEVSITPTPPSSIGVTITQIEPFRFPIRVPHEDPPRIEGNPAPADTRIGGKGVTFLSAASHNEDTCARSRLAPRLPPSLVRPGPTPPLPGASQMEASSLKLLRFCKYFP